MLMGMGSSLIDALVNGTAPAPPAGSPAAGALVGSPTPNPIPTSVPILGRAGQPATTTIATPATWVTAAPTVQPVAAAPETLAQMQADPNNAKMATAAIAEWNALTDAQKQTALPQLIQAIQAEPTDTQAYWSSVIAAGLSTGQIVATAAEIATAVAAGIVPAPTTSWLSGISTTTWLIVAAAAAGGFFLMSRKGGR